MAGDTTTDHATSGTAPSPLTLRVGALMFAGMACYGSATPVSRIVGRSFPTWLGSASRMSICVCVLAPIVLIRRRRGGDPPLREVVADMSGSDRWRLVVIGLVGTFGFSAFMLIGMREAPGSVGAVVMATTPAVTGVASALFLHESFDRWRATAITLAVVGVVVVNVAGGVDGSDGDLVVVGSLLVFAAVCCEATYTLVGKQLSTDLDPMSLTLLAALVAVLGFAPLALWDLATFDWSAPTTTEWAGVLWWGAGTMALGSVLWFAGVRVVSGTTASVFMGIMPVSALVLSWILLDEPFRWVQVVGMAIVLAGLGVIAWRSHHR